MNEIQKIIDAGLVFVASLQKMVGDVVKSFCIANINGQYFNVNLGSECQNTYAPMQELPETFKFGIRGYFLLDKNVLSLIKGFWEYFGYPYIALDTKSVHTSQLDDMVWFTVSRNKISNSAKYILEFYMMGMEEGKNYTFRNFPFGEKITSVTFTEDSTSLKSPSRRTIHLHIGEQEYFTHWVYVQDYFHDEPEALIGLPLLEAAEKVLRGIYD